MTRFHWYRFFEQVKPCVRADGRHTSGLLMLCRWSVWLDFASRLYSPNMCVYVTGGVAVVLFLMNYQGHSCSGDRHNLIKCVFKWWMRPKKHLILRSVCFCLFASFTWKQVQLKNTSLHSVCSSGTAWQHLNGFLCTGDGYTLPSTHHKEKEIRNLAAKEKMLTPNCYQIIFTSKRFLE